MARRQLLRGFIVIAALGASCALFSAASHAQEDGASPKTANPQDTPKAWVLRLPVDQKVSFAGQVNMDAAGMASSSMLYPVPGVAGLIVAVLTHGAIVEAGKKDQKDRLQQSANSILRPYQETLDGFTHQELTQLTLAGPLMKGRARTDPAASQSGDAGLLESTPRFLFTQDMSSIILDNEITINGTEGGSPAGYRTVVRVISTAVVHDQISQFWLADAGSALKQKSAALLAESLDVALRSFVARTEKNETPLRTFRYMEGTTEKIERGQLLRSHCNRTVVTSLRGTFISFPSRPPELTTPETQSSCTHELATASP